MFLETVAPAQGFADLPCQPWSAGKSISREMPMKYAGVRGLGRQPEAVAAVRMSGSEVVFAFAVEHAEGPVLTVREARRRAAPDHWHHRRRVDADVRVLDLANLYMGDHVGSMAFPT